jgi:hypothetical protein
MSRTSSAVRAAVAAVVVLALAACGSVILYATCRLDAGVVQITTAIDQRADRRDA